MCKTNVGNSPSVSQSLTLDRKNIGVRTKLNR